MKPVVEIREYRPAQDFEACRRAWTESGWVDGAKNEEAFRLLTESARSVVGTLGGSAECLVNVHPATLRYLDGDIRLACVTDVTTSRVVRRQGLAGRVTARALAEEALAGTPSRRSACLSRDSTTASDSEAGRTRHGARWIRLSSRSSARRGSPCV
ncbi:MAG: hypothetical protein PHV11_06465 [Candidatus Bipolaricaulis sp.]|nr:hypothetical protein [Candidatus Bipolaricaulis sp.]